MMEFRDCEYRFIDGELLYCENKGGGKGLCDNCKENVHLNCEHYSPKKDYCLKFFEENASENYKECKEKSVFNDKDLSRKWSN